MNSLDDDGGAGSDDWTDETGDARWELGGNVELNPQPNTSLPGISAAYVFDGSNPTTELDALGVGGAQDSFSNVSVGGQNVTERDATFEIWFKSADVADNDVIFETGATGDGLSLTLNGDVLTLFHLQSNNGNNESITQVYDLGANGIDPTTEFVQVSWVYDRSTGGVGVGDDTVELFINGSSVNTTTELATASDDGLDDWAGGNDAGLGGSANGFALNDGAGGFEGEIAIMRFYSNTLTAAEIEQNYQAVAGTDTDGDGIVDHCDLDSDNDGISDLVESGDVDGIAADVNNDGFVSQFEGIGDTDSDGLMDVFEDGDLNADTGTDPVDTDSDGIRDYVDLDSDNDQISDLNEGQPTAGFIDLGTGDDDSDGILNSFDGFAGHGSDGSTLPTFSEPEDTDSDGDYDFQDTDSDSDGLADSI